MIKNASYSCGGARHIWEERHLRFKIREVSRHGEKMAAKIAIAKKRSQAIFSP